MLGAIAGDIAGSVYEHRAYKSPDLALFAPHPATGKRVTFTDDSVCTVAIADWLLADPEASPAAWLRRWVAAYPHAGYGGMFRKWAKTPGMDAYNSWGNGAAMRVGPCGWAGSTPDEAAHLAERSAAVTHNHPSAMAGAACTARAIAALRQGAAAPALRSELAERYGYDLSPTPDAIRPGYGFDVSCAGTVPPALICAFEAGDVDEALRLAISLGGDSDTLAAITGSVAEARWGGLPEAIAGQVWAHLPADMAGIATRFRQRFGG